MIILILISQYFYNNIRQVVTAFYLDTQLTIFFLSTFNNWPPRFCCGIFLKVSCQFQKIFLFIKYIYIYMNILSMILAYFAIDNKIKLFFLALFFFINKKITSMLQPTHLYKFVSISVIFLSFSLSHFLPSIFFSVFLFISNSKRVTMSMCMVKKSSTSNAKTYINYYFIFLVSHLVQSYS